MRLARPVLRARSNTNSMARFLPPPPFPGSRRVLLFDLDETLYPRESGLIPFQRERVYDFMAAKLHVARDKVPDLWQGLFAEHNQTFAGLLAYQRAHADTVAPFTEAEYEAAIRSGYGKLKPDPALRALLLEKCFPDAKGFKRYVFTNASEGHTARALAALGLEGCFHGVYGTAFLGDGVCKPQDAAYDKVLEAIAPDAVAANGERAAGGGAGAAGGAMDTTDGGDDGIAALMKELKGDGFHFRAWGEGLDDAFDATGGIAVDPGPPARVSGTACVLFEDNLRNIRAAKERFGINTVYVAGASATEAALEKAERDPAVNLAVRTLADVAGRLDKFL